MAVTGLGSVTVLRGCATEPNTHVKAAVLLPINRRKILNMKVVNEKQIENVVVNENIETQAVQPPKKRGLKPKA